MHTDDGEKLITVPQKDFLKTLCWQKHITTEEICTVAGVRYLSRMPRAKASELIDLLKTNDGALKRRIAEIRGQLSLM